MHCGLEAYLKLTSHEGHENMSRHTLSGLGAAACVIVIVALVGCGGSNSAPPPNNGNGLVTGTGSLAGVVRSSDLTRLFTGTGAAGARIVASSGQSIFTDANGRFMLTDMPDGTVTLTITPNDAAFSVGHFANVPVTPQGQTPPDINFTLIPVAPPVPTDMAINPQQILSMDVGATTQFTCVAWNNINYLVFPTNPTWILEPTSGGTRIGTFDLLGKFTATAPGTATVHAVLGNIVKSATVTVMPAGTAAPRFVSVSPSANAITKPGGLIAVTAAITDAVGISMSSGIGLTPIVTENVYLEVLLDATAIESITAAFPPYLIGVLPNLSSYIHPAVLTAGTVDPTNNFCQDGTYRFEFSVPANPGSAPQTYGVNVHATDRNAQSSAFGFVNIEVLGGP